MWMLKWLGIAILLILLLGFSIQNLDQTVDVDLLFWSFQDVPLISVIFVTFIVGMMVWFVIAMVNELKLRAELRQTHRQRDELRGELQAMRNMPFEEPEEEEELADYDVAQ